MINRLLISDRPSRRTTNFMATEKILFCVTFVLFGVVFKIENTYAEALVLITYL